MIMKVDLCQTLGKLQHDGISGLCMRERDPEGLGRSVKLDHFRVATALFLQPKNKGAR
jgi:hypothetical protein